VTPGSPRRRGSRRGRRRVVAAAAALAAAPALAGCVQTEGGSPVTAGCGTGADAYNPTLVVMAQSVPTAELIPCVELVPTGWSHGPVTLTNRGSRFVLGSDRDGPRALTVELAAACDVTGAVRVPSEQPGTVRYERLDRLDGGFSGARFYVYDGGCTTFHFDLVGRRQAQPVTEASLAVGFTTRDAVRESVLVQSGGAVSVDTLGKSG
jgi:hypothetical protein